MNKVHFFEQTSSSFAYNIASCACFTLEYNTRISPITITKSVGDQYIFVKETLIIVTHGVSINQLADQHDTKCF